MAKPVRHDATVCVYLRNVKHRLPQWAMLLVLAAVCIAIIAGVALYRTRATSPTALVARLPADGAVILSIDFAALRRAGVLGILGGSKITQEPEYRVFVEQTGFDYINDLDTALISFHRSGTYFLLRGRFDWKALEEYVAHEGGACHNAFCRVAGSVPKRKISFFPLRADLMALAVGDDEYAAQELSALKPARHVEIPGDPVWSLIPVGELKKDNKLPAAGAAFVRALEGAQSVLLAAGPDGKRFAIRFDATCGSAADAAALATRLRDITAHLRDAAATPDPKDLGGVLSAGAFEQKGTHVLGRWPVEREFLQSLAGGTL